MSPLTIMTTGRQFKGRNHMMTCVAVDCVKPATHYVSVFGYVQQQENDAEFGPYCKRHADMASWAPVESVAEDNARLIVAAPDLLAALQALDAIHNFADTIRTENWGLYEDHTIPEVKTAYLQAIAAIAKAIGK